MSSEFSASPQGSHAKSAPPVPAWSAQEKNDMKDMSNLPENVQKTTDEDMNVAQTALRHEENVINEGQENGSDGTIMEGLTAWLAAVSSHPELAKKPKVMELVGQLQHELATSPSNRMELDATMMEDATTSSTDPPEVLTGVQEDVTQSPSACLKHDDAYDPITLITDPDCAWTFLNDRGSPESVEGVRIQDQVKESSSARREHSATVAGDSDALMSDMEHAWTFLDLTESPESMPGVQEEVNDCPASPRGEECVGRLKRKAEHVSEADDEPHDALLRAAAAASLGEEYVARLNRKIEPVSETSNCGWEAFGKIAKSLALWLSNTSVPWLHWTDEEVGKMVVQTALADLKVHKFFGPKIIAAIQRKMAKPFVDGRWVGCPGAVTGNHTLRNPGCCCDHLSPIDFRVIKAFAIANCRDVYVIDATGEHNWPVKDSAASPPVRRFTSRGDLDDGRQPGPTYEFLFNPLLKHNDIVLIVTDRGKTPTGEKMLHLRPTSYLYGEEQSEERAHLSTANEGPTGKVLDMQDGSRRGALSESRLQDSRTSRQDCPGVTEVSLTTTMPSFQGEKSNEDDVDSRQLRDKLAALQLRPKTSLYLEELSAEGVHSSAASEAPTGNDVDLHDGSRRRGASSENRVGRSDDDDVGTDQLVDELADELCSHGVTFESRDEAVVNAWCLVDGGLKRVEHVQSLWLIGRETFLERFCAAGKVATALYPSLEQRFKIKNICELLRGTAFYNDGIELRIGGVHGRNEKIADALKLCPVLARVKVYSSSAMIRSAEAASLAEGMKTCPFLHTVDVSDNYIDTGEAASFAQGMRSCPHLQTLDLSDNYIKDAAVALFAEGMKCCPRLVTVDLSDNYIKDAGAASFAEGMKACPLLLTVNISDNYIHGAGASAFAEGMKSCRLLHTVNISDNYIDDAGMVAVAESMQSCPFLLTVNVSRNYIRDSGAESLAEGMKWCILLQTVDISHNKIGNSGAAAFAAGMTSCPQLQTVDISGNLIDASGASSFSGVFESCPQLQTLNTEGRSRPARTRRNP